MNTEDIFSIIATTCEVCGQVRPCLVERSPDPCALCSECINNAFGEYEARSKVKSTNDPIVLLRAAGGLPKVLFIEEGSPTHVAVKPYAGAYHRPLWFPRSMLFRFTRELFEGLKSAYKSGDTGRLNSLWGEAEQMRSEA